MTDQRTIVNCPARTAAQRQAILEEYDSYPRDDARRGALLRRHSVYTLQVAVWRQRLAQDEMTLEHQLPRSKPPSCNPLHDEIALLRCQSARLEARLAQAIIDVQKKVASLLDLTFPTSSELS